MPTATLKGTTLKTIQKIFGSSTTTIPITFGTPGYMEDGKAVYFLDADGLTGEQRKALIAYVAERDSLPLSLARFVVRDHVLFTINAKDVAKVTD